MTLPDNLVRHPYQPKETMIWEADGLYVKQTVVEKAGTYLPQHAHILEHITLLTTGSVRLWKDGELAGEFTGPVGISIQARVKHLFETLTDGVVLYCIHELTSPDALRVLAEHNILEYTGS